MSFTVGDAGGDLDVFQIRSYDLSDTLINTQDVSGVSRLPVSIAVAGIHRVEIDFTGSFGFSLDDLTFNTPTPGTTATPEPSTMALGLLGLAGIAVGRFRKRGR